MDDEWERVGQAIERRLDDVGFTKAEIHREFGITGETLTLWMEGKPIVRRDKKRQLEKALGWRPGSIDRIRAGGEAELLTASVPDLPSGQMSTDDLMSILNELQARQRAVIEELARRSSDR